METENEQRRAAEKILEDEALISNLMDNEAKVLIDWAMSELEAKADVQAVALDDRVARVRAAMKEINELVGNKQTLVADDLEERMGLMLVGDLDPASQVRLQVEREIAQVTAEKDHLESVELIKQLTQLASQAWRSRLTQDTNVLHGQRAAATATVKAHAADEVATPAPEPAPASPPSTERPIPRPTPIEPRKRGFFARLFGRK